jgi:hypothetical protein
MSTASAVYHDRMVMEIKTPYNRDFVERLKTAVPHEFRQWNPQHKTWFIQAPYDTDALRVLRAFYPDADVDEKPGAGRYSSSSSGCGCDADHRALYVCQSAPPEVVRAAYRALSRTHHPDAGGDLVSMQRLNDAYERIQSGTLA